MSEGDDDVDRRAILGRRAAFVSAALAAMSCTKGAPPPEPPRETAAPPVRPVEVDPGGETLEPEPADSGVPPLDVPPGIDEADRVALEQFAMRISPLHDKLEGVRSEMPDCALPEPQCQKDIEAYVARLDELAQDLTYLHPLCGFSEDTRTVVAQRLGAHTRYLENETARVRERLREAQAAHGEAATSALGVLEVSRAVAVPCLSCLAPSGLVLAGRTIPFEHDSSTPLDTGVITRLAAQMSGFPGTTVEVRGHADPSEAQGEALSMARANAVVAALTAAGVEPTRLVARAFGTKLRVDAFDTETVRAANRRVDFEVR